MLTFTGAEDRPESVVGVVCVSSRCGRVLQCQQ